VTLALVILGHPAGTAQEKSDKPGINDPFQNPDVKKHEALANHQTSNG